MKRYRYVNAITVCTLITYSVSLLGLPIYARAEDNAAAMQQTFEDNVEWSRLLNEEVNKLTLPQYNQAAEVIPYYGKYPVEASYYNNGQGDLTAITSSKMSSCEGVDTPECQAISFIGENPTKRQQVSVEADDPLLQTGRSLRNSVYTDPASSNPLAPVTTQYTDCTQHEAKQEAVYVTETCQDYLHLEEYICEKWIEAKVVTLPDGTTQVVTELVSGDCPTQGQCYVEYQECLEGPETRMINGVPVYQACWRWATTYACILGPETTCGEYENRPECELEREECISESGEGPNEGNCDVIQKTFSCLKSEAKSVTYTDCHTTKLCLDEAGGFHPCFDTYNPQDQDFRKAMLATEISRQAGGYFNQQSHTMYDMADSRCTVSYLPPKDCCKPNDSGTHFTNNTSMGLGIALAGQAVKTGAKYVFDTLIAPKALTMLEGGLVSTMGTSPISSVVAAINSVISPYGVTIGIGLPVSGNVFVIGNYMVTFNQVMLMVQIAMFLYAYLMSCDDESLVTDTLMAQNLCHYVGSYCTRRILGICVQIKQTYCCSNSRLGLAINEQGRQQIGKGWGDPANPMCIGFSTDEFARLNFDEMNLEGFSDEMQMSVQYPIPSEVKAAIGNSIATGQFKNPYDPIKKEPTHVSQTNVSQNYYDVLPPSNSFRSGR